MTLADFEQAPWKRENTHARYKQSALSISPAPEYASSEILVASLYRTVGFKEVSEGGIPQAGRELDRKIQKLRDKPSKAPEGITVDVSTWSAVLHGILESPKLPNQSSKRFLQVTPLVPGTALFSGSARLSNNSWPAGSLVRRMVSLGSKDKDAAQSLWKDLFLALSVDEGDDVFARWLEKETYSWGAPQKWELVPIPESESISLAEEDFKHVPFLPARQFSKDLRAIIQAKDAMTRRQWTSLLEAVLRLASVSHVTWLCDVQVRIWRCLSDALDMNGPKGANDTRQALFPTSAQYMTYGGKALPGLKHRASGYLAARLGINTVLWSLDKVGSPYEGNLSSSQGIASLCQHIRDNHTALVNLNVRQKIVDIREREARALNCKKGIGANLHEFARHALGQRRSAIPLLRGYDQGYILKQKGKGPSSPWIVSLGPVAVLALVHCALAGMGGPRSIHRLGQHLAAYGIAIDRHDIASNDLGHQLRMLGLVLDSPDAESGMLLLPPFPVTQAMDNAR
ncbi:hypothetical protein LY622_17705 [Halomonas sp. M5N1S17]|uniref:hypothetical protein n=1 Tax=Halomonas alkalisoli TaxID=2907158 RepID=UPI001F476C56|nr:hypothetical protein [Halomonas alkalisoli]MCE9665266.1 hypothetical protein [Halomonas alkalisoli]